MNTTWRVTKVTETEGSTVAELERVEWFRGSPQWAEQQARYDAIAESEGAEAADEQAKSWPEVEEYLGAEPGEPGANFIDVEGRMTLDISREDDLDLHAGDNVVIEVRVVAPVEA